MLLERLGLSLGYVYMAMGIMIGELPIIRDIPMLIRGTLSRDFSVMPGSAVVPVSCALLLETANGTACTTGAVIGFGAAISTWLYVASINDVNGEISLASTGGQYPLLFGSILPRSSFQLVPVSH